MGTSAASGIRVQEVPCRGRRRGSREAETGPLEEGRTWGTTNFKRTPPLGEKMKSRDSEQMGSCWGWSSRPECGGGLRHDNLDYL